MNIYIYIYIYSPFNFHTLKNSLRSNNNWQSCFRPPNENPWTPKRIAVGKECPQGLERG